MPAFGGAADGRRDRRGRRVRRRTSAASEPGVGRGGVRARRHEARRLQGRQRVLRAGVRQSRVQPGAEACARSLRREDRDRPDRSRLPPHRARARRRWARALRRRRRLRVRDGSAVCWSGYYHGILERAFAGVSEEDLPAVSRRLCASAQVRRSDFIAYQCVHGLGHGLMIYTDYDMPLSLETCDALVDGLGPDLVHGRRVHGEPPDVVRDSFEVAARRRPALSRARPSRSGTSSTAT